MKLDPDVVRDVLLKIEREQSSPKWKYAVSDREADYPIYYALTKLDEGGYVKVTHATGTEREDWVYVTELTMRGHEFLDSVRDDTVWGQTKEKAAKVGAYGLKALWDIAISVLASRIAG